MIPTHLFVKQPWYDLNNCGTALAASIINNRLGKRVFEIKDMRDDTRWWTIFDIRNALNKANIQTGNARITDTDKTMIVRIRLWGLFNHWIMVEPLDSRNIYVTNPYFYGRKKTSISKLYNMSSMERTLEIL